jgi:hypothetical protein
VFLQGRRPNLVRVFVLFDTGLGGARLEDVHLFDAHSRVVTLDVITSGTHLAIDADNTFKVDPPRQFLFGLGVSFRFASSVGPTGQPQRVFIATVGADFES